MQDTFNRGTGFLVIDVACSNPNGDPDAESEPRMFDDGRGLISPVSFKRKLRDLMEIRGDVFQTAIMSVGHGRNTDILETRGRTRKEIAKMSDEAFKATFWDARVFGSTFLEEKVGSHIAAGAVQFGPGVSIAPLEITRLTLTNKSGVEDEKDRGMAPLAFRVARHGLYVMPFFVNASAAKSSGCDKRDVELLKFLIPFAYKHTASAMRSQVEIVHAWYAEHKTPLGSCPDPLILSALRPKKLENPEKPSLSIADYDVPKGLPEALLNRLASFEDLCEKEWPMAIAA